ncbi:MAG TPA: hypothetical protein VFE53_15120 [Mucilaginibacter sp.]|jgi:hypothetical protein|nr:hypothetical protein [Mucilaginibacter sp.]
MWPFKKKNTEIPRPTVKSIICIPGYWKDPVEIFGRTEGKLALVGNAILMDIKNKTHYTFELCGRDKKMRKSFDAAGKVTGVSSDFLDEIEKHTSVIYITGDTGNFRDAKSIANAAALICDTGGIGVKVETTGKAFKKSKWLKFVEAGDDASLYELFVLDSLMMEDGTTYSCGMHNIGYRDVMVSGLEFKEAQHLVRIFNYHRVIDKPIIKTGETFSLSMQSPIYFITNELQQPYIDEELFYNPFGMWRLVRAE